MPPPKNRLLSFNLSFKSERLIEPNPEEPEPDEEDEDDDDDEDFIDDDEEPILVELKGSDPLL